jgi:putative redox protein
MKTEEFFILNKHGLKLAANLDSPYDGKIKAYAVFAHCFTCSKELKSIVNINRSLTELGYAVLCFDLRGIGESDGYFPDNNFKKQIEDFLSAAAYLSKNHKPAKLLIGTLAVQPIFALSFQGQL